ncbi:MAG: GGDEF domain-containing protein [Acidobacteria bacterium]|nr:GGDEF domain-containing protein [Acidobacteriota bacterium]
MNAEQAVAIALNRWSLTMQVAIVFVMAVVFLALWSSSQRETVLTWFQAWVSDLVALLVVLTIAATSTTLSFSAQLFLYLVYAVSKIAFAALLLIGLEQFYRSRWVMGAFRRRLALVMAVLFVAAFLVRPPLVAIQAVVDALVGLLTGAAAVYAFSRSDSRGTRLLPVAFFIHSAIFIHHSLVLGSSFVGTHVPSYLSHVSFIDAGAELLIGLMLLLALGNVALSEMIAANARLEAAQRSLRGLVDADPLTGLYNRRKLRRFAAATQDRPGVVIYIDVDRFKTINDRWGHATGDASLVRVASALRTVFRTEDGLFRIGGDEFLVVAPGLEPEDALERIARLRTIIGRSKGGNPAIAVSVGVSKFGNEVPMDQALALADAAMYEEKALR